jgi:hypothetical protein
MVIAVTTLCSLKAEKHRRCAGQTVTLSRHHTVKPPCMPGAVDNPGMARHGRPHRVGGAHPCPHAAMTCGRSFENHAAHRQPSLPPARPPS